MLLYRLGEGVRPHGRVGEGVRPRGQVGEGAPRRDLAGAGLLLGWGVRGRGSGLGHLLCQE